MTDNSTMGAGEHNQLADAVIAEAIDKLKDTYLPWIEHALNADPSFPLWKRANNRSNSVGNLLLHLEGNVRQWILHGLGGVEDTRQRDVEFQSTGGEDADTLFSRLRETVHAACTILESYRDEALLLKSMEIQGFQTTGLSAIIHIVEHFSYHTGQIVWAVKAYTNQDMEFYDL